MWAMAFNSPTNQQNNPTACPQAKLGWEKTSNISLRYSYGKVSKVCVECYKLKLLNSKISSFMLIGIYSPFSPHPWPCSFLIPSPFITFLRATFLSSFLFQKSRFTIFSFSFKNCLLVPMTPSSCVLDSTFHILLLFYALPFCFPYLSPSF